MKSRTKLYPFASNNSLKVSQLIDTKGTKNTAICFSGGSSKALISAAGQLRAIKTLNNKDGNLLEQTRLISSVSGGSWLTGIFSYINNSIHDDELLGKYVADQSRLVLTAHNKSIDPSLILDYLPENHVGHRIDSDKINIVQSIIFCLFLHLFRKVPLDKIWSTFIGLKLLKKYNIFQNDAAFHPTTLFTYNDKTRQEIYKEISGSANALIMTPASEHNIKRPFWSCNINILIQGDDGQNILIPFFSNPICSGTLLNTTHSSHKETSIFQRSGITSYAINSVPKITHDDNTLTIESEQFWSLTDAIGASSAFFSQYIVDLIKKLQNDHDHCAQAIKEHGSETLETFKEHYKEDQEIQSIHIDDALRRVEYFLLKFCGIENLEPKYLYYSLSDPEPMDEVKSYVFADGGITDNTGILGALAYNDIDKIIAFVNGTKADIKVTNIGIIDENGKEIPDTRFALSDFIPGLFGYQPFQKDKGYILYEGATDISHPSKKNNHVFHSSDFVPILQELGKKQLDGSPVAVLKKLRTLENKYYSIAKDREITIIIQLLQFNQKWHDSLSPAVQAEVDKIRKEENFPNYPMRDMFLSKTETNLLSHFTSWALIQIETEIRQLYES